MAAAFAVTVGLAGCRAAQSQQTHEASSVPCELPISVRLGSIDPQFDVSPAELSLALRGAMEAWEAPAGRRLFVFHPQGELAINLAYDQRQLEVFSRRDLDESKVTFNGTVESHEKRVKELVAQQEEFKRQTDHFNRLLREHNEVVESWNRRGGAPSDEFARLRQYGADLERQRVELESRQATLNLQVQGLRGVEDQLKQRQTDLNQLIEQHNTYFKTFRQFIQVGRFRLEGRESDITVFRFESPGELQLILAHELGHAMGIGHLPETDALMHESTNGQRRDVLRATEADIGALYRHCGL